MPMASCFKQGREDVEVGRQRRRSLQYLANQYGVDQMRYFFLREVPFGQDAAIIMKPLLRASMPTNRRQRSRQSGATLAVDDRKPV